MVIGDRIAALALRHTWVGLVVACISNSVH